MLGMKRFIIILLTVLSCLILNAEVRIHMENEGGVYKVPCTINGLKLKFIFDTGASNVCMSQAYAEMMLENGYLNESDILGMSQSTIADGSNIDNIIINLRKVEIGGLILDNVSAVVVPTQNAPLLLGQSVIQKLGKVTIDGNDLVIHNADLYSDDEIDEIREKADDYFDNDFYSKAVELYKTIYSSYGDDINPWLLYRIGFCYIQLNERPTGYEYYLRAVELAEEDEEEYQDLLFTVYNKLTSACFIEKDYVNALNYARLALRYATASDRGHCLYLIADAYYWRGKYTDAINYYNESIGELREYIDSDYDNRLILYDFIDSFMKKGNIMMSKSRYQEARDLYNEALNYLSKYQKYMLEDDYDALKRLSEQAIKLCRF